MASSSDRDKNTNDSQPKPDNPFIKFRQFADSQISSLLQGVIGLPSAFTKSPNNERWADFDDDMRRRDELQKRQNELRDSEARKLNEGPGWSSSEDSKPNTADDEEMDEKTARDIPLYSPVSKSLFAHLREAKHDLDPRGDWTPVDPRYPLSFTPNFYDAIRGYRSHLDPIKALRTTVYRDLNINAILRSDYSLLPYLLFSPYSPLKLLHDKPMPASQVFWEPFPYCEAFEDLILTTQGRPINSLPEDFCELFGVEPERGWIYGLWAYGVLQQSSTTQHADVIRFQNLLTGYGPSVPGPNSGSAEEDAQTEQELYERFLRRASASAGIGGILESMFADAEGWINKSLASLDPAEMKRQLKEFTNFLEQKTGNDAEDEKRAKAAKTLESLFAQATELFEGRRSSETVEEKPTIETFAETKIGKELQAMKAKAAADPNKPIFTSTMTEHTTNEDGSVEHSVTVWKRYGDGRETTTTTSHTEEPGDGDTEPSWPGREQRSDVEKVEDKKDEKKQGWFWN